MNALVKLALCSLLAGILPGCKRAPPPEKLEEPTGRTQLVPDDPEPSAPPVIPTPRNGHPGTITYVCKSNGSQGTLEVRPISELPDSAIFKYGVPVVRVELWLIGNGNCCAAEKGCGGRMTLYGPKGEELAWSESLPGPSPPRQPSPPLPTFNPRTR